MAGSEWDAIDLKTTEFRDYYCAFIDILGYKEKSRLFFENQFNLFGRVQRALDTVSFIMGLSSLATDLSELKVRFFSDSIIITNPCKPYSLAGLLHYATTLAANLSFEDLFIRGGIARGRQLDSLTRVGSPFLASEALQKAYSLESKLAVNPRILLDPDLAAEFGIEESALVVNERDDYIAHFGNVLISRNGDNHKDVFSEMLDIESARDKAVDDRVRGKYQWVLDYYYWTICSSKGFDSSKYEQFASGEDRGFSRLQ